MNHAKRVQLELRRAERVSPASVLANRPSVSGEADPSVPNVGKPAVHRNRIVCPSCNGKGGVMGFSCIQCGGAKTVMAGCGGEGTVDAYWKMANCKTCGVMPSPEFRTLA